MNDSNPSAPNPRFAVIGGGISGLTAAYRLQTLVPSAKVDLFEVEPRLGGVLCTVHEGELLLECGADSFITKQPWAWDLCEELGLASELIPTRDTDRRAMVLHGGQLHPVPEGFFMLRPQKALPILGSNLLSWRGKLRLFAEPFVRSADLSSPDADVSLAQFATERLGREPYERLVEPLLAGIFTADATRLSVAATMPDALEHVRRHGSLLRGMLHRPSKAQDSENNTSSGARYGSFVTPREGVGQLIAALAKKLPDESLHIGQEVQTLERTTDGNWTLGLESSPRSGPYAGIILALPTHASARLLQTIDNELSCQLDAIEYASSAIVCLLLEKKDFARPIQGFGYVVPRVERNPVIACSYSSEKFPGRCVESQIILRVFMGGALDPLAVEQPDEALIKTAIDAVRASLGATGEPRFTKVVRWIRRMPQYHVGHLQRVAAIEAQAATIPGLELAGNGYRGVGIPYCIRSGNEAARRLVDWHRSRAALAQKFSQKG